MTRGSRLDELFTLLFMALAIGAVICYFTLDNGTVYLVLGGGAVLLRIIQYIMRFF